MRKAEITRKTAETNIGLTLVLDGSGKSEIDTGIPFLDHMLTLWTAHGNFDLTLKAMGDIEVDHHHTVEDIGICLGQALREALGDKQGIRRYGFSYVPMDEALCRAVLDISNRPFLRMDVSYPSSKTGEFDVQLVQEFFQAVTNNAGLTLHIAVEYGNNVHHIIEAIFKAFTKSLSHAVSIDPVRQGIPSTKGLL